MSRSACCPRSLLPPTPEAWGTTDPDGPFGRRVPIAGVIGDQQAALLGQLRRRPGEAKCTYGTGAFLLMHTGNEAVASNAGLLTTVAYSDSAGVDYALEGSVAVAGSLVQWLRDQLGFAESAAEVERLALEVEDSGGRGHRARVLRPLRSLVALRRPGGDLWVDPAIPTGATWRAPRSRPRRSRSAR